MCVEKKGPDFEGFQSEVKMLDFCGLGKGELLKQGSEMIMLVLQQPPCSGCVEGSRMEELTHYMETVGILLLQESFMEHLHHLGAC